MRVTHLDVMPESRPIRDIAYDMLKHAIITGEIPAGERIVETEYAKRLHISRTPLREALRRLERDGLVECVVRRGVIVRAFTLKDISEIYTIRNALEMMILPAVIENTVASDIAALRAMLAEMDIHTAASDADALSPLARGFHNSLIRLSGQARIVRVIETQDEFVTRFSAMAIRQENRLKEAHAEHHRIVELIEQKDLEALSALMESHIEASKQNCLRAFQLQKEEQK